MTTTTTMKEHQAMTTDTMQFQIKNRYTGAVQFECELEARYESASYSVQLGAAVKLAVAARADLTGADLTGASLAGASLAGAYLTRANLARASLTRANLARAYLAGANLTDADLSGADLTGASLADAYLTGADLTRANLARAYLTGAYLVDGGQDRRGYRFWAWRHPNGHVVYRAGCREWQSLDEALAHFGDGYNSDGDPAECIARLRLMERCARERGWIGGTVASDH